MASPLLAQTAMSGLSFMCTQETEFVWPTIIVDHINLFDLVRRGYKGQGLELHIKDMTPNGTLINTVSLNSGDHALNRTSTTFVRSRQSMQLTLNTPFCEDSIPSVFAQKKP